MTDKLFDFYINPELFSFEKDEESISEDEEKALWRRLFRTIVAGRHLMIGSPGGDMWRLDATLIRIFPVIGLGPIAEIRDAHITEELTGESKPVNYRFVILSMYAPPSFNDPGISIILHAGAEEFVLENGENWEYSEMFFGIIY